MDNEQKAAYIQSQIVCANCELEVLKVQLKNYEGNGFERARDDVAAEMGSLPGKYGLTSNQVLSFLTGV